MANLAATYREQGRWNDAEGLEVQGMETSSRVLGQEHPSTLTSMNNLAFTYMSQGRRDEALATMEQVVALRSRILGADHPYTAGSISALEDWRHRCDDKE